MRKVKRYLRREVFGRSTECLHGSSVCDALLAEAEISDLDVTVFVQHQVLQLEGRQKNT